MLSARRSLRQALLLLRDFATRLKSWRRDNPSDFRRHAERGHENQIEIDFFEKESDLINFSRQAKGELERLLQS